MHHIAIAARDPERLAEFYEAVLELKRLRPAGITARSVWFSLGPDAPDDAAATERPGDRASAETILWETQSLLMLEQADATVADERTDGRSLAEGANHAGHTDFARKAAGIHLLALRIAPAERERWLRKLRAAGVRIENESPYTIYLRDPEGNRIGLSHYPERY